MLLILLFKRDLFLRKISLQPEKFEKAPPKCINNGNCGFHQLYTFTGGAQWNYTPGSILHSSNSYIGIIDEQLEKVVGKRLKNSLPLIIDYLAPYKKDLQGVVVESTYNWYWLVDGLQDQGYTVHLANPAAIKQYDGIKYSDDKWDALWLAHLLKLGILPQGYIYPKETRPMRDLLRRRMLFVRQRTADILSFQSMITRNTGTRISVNNIKKLTEENLETLFHHEDLIFMAQRYLSIIDLLSKQIKMIEKQATNKISLTEPFKWLSTINGVGKILTMVIMMEAGDMGRFKKVGNYCSYCRCVKSERISNGKKKGVGNKKERQQIPLLGVCGSG